MVFDMPTKNDMTRITIGDWVLYRADGEKHIGRVQYTRRLSLNVVLDTNIEIDRKSILAITKCGDTLEEATRILLRAIVRDHTDSDCDCEDVVDHPKHYTFGKFEVIDVIEDWGLDKEYHLGNVVKYIARSKHKGDELENLKKAQWYLDRKIKQLEKSEK